MMQLSVWTVYRGISSGHIVQVRTAPVLTNCRSKSITSPWLRRSPTHVWMLGHCTQETEEQPGRCSTYPCIHTSATSAWQSPACSHAKCPAIQSLTHLRTNRRWQWSASSHLHTGSSKEGCQPIHAFRIFLLEPISACLALILKQYVCCMAVLRQRQGPIEWL